MDPYKTCRNGFWSIVYLYCNASDKSSPFISPLFGDFKNSPLMIQYAENEMLSSRLNVFKKIKKAKVKVVTKIWKDLWHDFQLETDLPRLVSPLRFSEFPRRFALNFYLHLLGLRKLKCILPTNRAAFDRPWILVGHFIVPSSIFRLIVG